MSWPPNCPYHAWRPLAGPLKVGRCSLSRHSLVQLIHHKQLQRFKDFEVAGYQLECQRLTDPTKKQMRKKNKDDERKRGIFCAFGVKLTIGDGVNLRCFFSKLQLETSRYISVLLDFWRVETHASPFPASLDCFSFGFGLPWPLGLRLDNQVRFVWLDVFLIYISPETWNIFKRMFEDVWCLIFVFNLQQKHTGRFEHPPQTCVYSKLFWEGLSRFDSFFQKHVWTSETTLDMSQYSFSYGVFTNFVQQLPFPRYFSTSLHCHFILPNPAR